MKKCELRSKAARRIKWFELKESEIERLIEMDSFRYNLDRDPSCGEPYGSILRYISDMSEHKRHDLMCLMYLGRNIDYSGFDEETVDDFCFYADEWGRNGRISNHLHGAMDPEYLAGKIRIGKWLKLAKDAIIQA
jgi:hypothetical protein